MTHDYKHSSPSWRDEVAFFLVFFFIVALTFVPALCDWIDSISRP